MYKLQEQPDKEAKLWNGTVVKPLATLKENHGGISHIIKDDNCYVLINGSATLRFAMVKYWYPEAAQALAKLVSKKNPKG